MPTATHAPIIIESDDREQALRDLSGVRLLGHLARANQQWQHTPDGSNVLLVFTGPNAYVSPVHYSDAPAAPTWNYAAVHVNGTVRWIHGSTENMRILDLTIDRTETNEGTGWDREPSRAYFEHILPGVVGFEITVTDYTSTFKLGQDEAPHRREEMAHAAEEARAPELCTWIHKANPEVF